MDYYSSSKTGRRKKVVKVIWYILAYVLVFALSFFISFKLVAGTQSGEKEIEALKVEISELNLKLAEKEERILSLELQLENIQKSLAEAEANAEASQDVTDVQVIQ